MFLDSDVLEKRLNKYLLFFKKVLGLALIIFYVGGFSLTLSRVLNPVVLLASTNTGSMIGWPLMFVKEENEGGDVN
jgi:hypothetical protein